MKKWVLCSVLAILAGLIFFSSCREDFEFTPTSGNLTFSKDTVFLDTVFTNIGSSTYTLKVYNRTNQNILIPEIGLQNGTESSYRLNVDGKAGQVFTDVALLAKDSLFVFIETTFDIATTGENEFLQTESLRFGSPGNFQEVELVTLVKDAIFLYPNTLADGTKESLLLESDEEGNETRIEGFMLEDDELQFSAEKPYVIYGYAAVSENKTLTIAAGTRVHFHENSGLLIGNNASLQIDGALSTDGNRLENEVIFEGDRLEPDYKNISGQWGTIWLASGSRNNTINHLTIKNATVGLLVEGDDLLDEPTLTISNSQIHNSANVNLWMRKANVQGTNSIFGSAGSISLYCNISGNYSFKHCTVANYWTSGFRNTPALVIDDDLNDNTGNDEQNASFSNCIIDGNRELEILLSNQGEGIFNYRFLNCSITFRDARGDFSNNPLYDFSNETLFEGIQLNAETNFSNPAQYDFQLTQSSEVLNVGNLDTAQEVPLDILGNSRVSTPDLGAFERQE
ncbi:MAG: hypothetical protein ACFB0A_14175 [Croceivirga sp.]